MKKLLIFAAAAALLLAGCSKKGPVVESITVIPDNIALNIGEYRVLAANIEPFSAEEIAVTWTTSDPGIATVSASGRVTAVGFGDAVITASAGGKSGICNVTVLQVEIVDLGLPSGTLWADRNVGAALVGQYGAPFAWGEIESKESYSDQNYAWAHQEGDDYIYDKYSYLDGRTVLTAEDDPATAILGQGWRTPTETEWEELVYSCDWSWDSEKNCAVASKGGEKLYFPLPGVKPSADPGDVGLYWALSRVFDNEGDASAMYVYSDKRGVGEAWRGAGASVRAVYAPRIMVTGVSLEEGISYTCSGSHTFHAIIEPFNATEQNVLWSSSNQDVAVINLQGELTPVSEGTTTVTATTVDGALLASCEVTVTLPADLTVCDGTATNGYVPIYGFYADAYLKCEMVYPASMLENMSGGSIQEMRFYADQSNIDWGTNFKVFLVEVSSESISNFRGYEGATIVYEGHLSVVNHQLVIPFTSPYTYNGGNLLVGVYQTNEGTYISSPWYGQAVDNACVQGYSYSSLDAVAPTQRHFLPKTTFTF